MVFYLLICLDQPLDGDKKNSKILPEFWLVFLSHSVLKPSKFAYFDLILPLEIWTPTEFDHLANFDIT